jgi:predicted RND superfamily exporter protein
LAIAAGTTAVGFYSFVTTDVTPMRAFGLACGSGVIICWLTSLTLVPAVVAIWPRHASQHLSLEVLGDWMVATWHWARRQRRALIVLAIVVASCTVGPMLRVHVRMEPRAFFRVESDPWRAERFLDERFGGATFMQVALHGDLDDAATLRQLGRLSDFARAQPGVTQVQSIAAPLMLVDDVMGAGLRLPATRAQAANLYFFLQGEAGMRELITDDRHDALVHVRLRGNAGPAMAALEAFARTLPRMPTPPDAHDVAERIAWVAQAHGKKVAVEDVERTVRVLAEPGDADLEWTTRRGSAIDAFFASEEAPPMSDAARAEVTRLAAAHAEGAVELRAALVKYAPSPEEGSLACANLVQRLSDERRRLAVTRATPLVLRAATLPVDDTRIFNHVSSIVDDLFAHIPKEERAAVPLSASVSGEPILDRGFSRSVGDNQIRSLVVTIILVLVLMFALFRSLKLALISMAPSLLTMALIFGVMGMLDVPIDLGTSLVAGIATGAGSDFAMHYLWYLRRQRADEVSRTVGPVMVVSIVLVSLGFWVLALGKSPVMHLFGTLAGLSMFLSALLTCLLVPAVLNKVDA